MNNLDVNFNDHAETSVAVLENYLYFCIIWFLLKLVLLNIPFCNSLFVWKFWSDNWRLVYYLLHIYRDRFISCKYYAAEIIQLYLCEESKNRIFVKVQE